MKINNISILFFVFLTFSSIKAQQNNHLQAILIVGHQEDGTQNAMEKMNEIANTFIANGVQVHKYYDKQANWNEITNTAKNCNFFVYSGHGSTMGVNGNVGGLCINSMVSTSELLQNLKLKPNSLILFQSVCNGAGSSASDDNDIGINEAKIRVTNYAYPFFDIGASGYFASNFQSGVNDFLKDFFTGKSINSAFHDANKIWSKIEFEGTFPNYQGKFLGIASSDGGGTVTRTSYVNGVKKVETFISPKDYPVAAAGNPNFTINQMK